MKTFTKKIVRSNTYEVPGPDGTSRREVITPERIKQWAETANKMLDSGLKIPAPINHDFEALPIVVGSDGLADASKNAGFWTRFFSKEEDGRTVLYGALEVPDALADKVGKTIQETSIYVRPEFKDGLGRVWKDAPMHVALVNHPVEPGQDNFQPDDALALSMSMENGDPPRDYGSAASRNKVPNAQIDPSLQTEQICNIQELVTRLREVARIALPADTDSTNICERLLAALEQKQLSELEGDFDDDKATLQTPNNSREPSKPIVMSKQTNNQKDDQRTSSQQTSGPYYGLTPEQINELVMSHPAHKQALDTTKNLLGYVTESAKRSISNRINRLIRAGVCTKEYADKFLLPHVEKHHVAFGEDGRPVPSQVEILLEGLEALPSPVQQKTPGNNPEAALSGVAMAFNPMMIPGSFDEVRKAFSMSFGSRMDDLETAPKPAGASASLDSEAMDKLADSLVDSHNYRYPEITY